MNDVMMVLLMDRQDWFAWRDKIAEFNLTKAPAPRHYPVVAALIVSSWGMQELEPRYVYVKDIPLGQDPTSLAHE
jgi:hypothetical protein